MASDLDIENLDSQLSAQEFDAVSYIDVLLPDEGSLVDLSEVIDTIQSRMKSSTIAIRDAIRIYSTTGNDSEGVLTSTKNLITDLSGRITNIRDQASETETTVTQICKDIKPLDNAKKNLTTTVTVLRRLQMMTTTISKLEVNIDQLNYSECAANILALTTFLDDFQKYETAPQLKPLLSKFYDLKRALRNKINTELETKFYTGTGTTANLAVCAVIDAYGGDFRSSTIEIFCEKFLAPYEDAFRNSGLNEMHSRYQWFKMRIDFFNKQYSCSFPKEWKMPYYLARAFCHKTARHVNSILKLTSQLDVNQYLRAFEVTVKFEQRMSEVFSTVKTVFIDENAPLPNFPETAEGIRQKYAWLQRRDKHIGEVVKEPAIEFIGTVACAFAPHIDIYLNSERQNLEKIIKDAENRPENDIDTTQKIMSSSTTLILSMKSCLDKCAGFNVIESLLDLFKMLKNLLKQYAAMLSRIMPTRIKKDEQYILICCIANTTSLLLSIVDSLSTKVSSLIESYNKTRLLTKEKEEMLSTSPRKVSSMSKLPIKDVISVDDVNDSVGADLRKQLIQLVDLVIKECETPLSQIGTNQWQPSEMDIGNRVSLPPKLTEILFGRFNIINTWLSNENLNRLRSPFTQRVVAVVRDAMFRTKGGVSASAAPRIAVTAKELKLILQECTKAESEFAKKRVDYEFMQLETELLILCCPDIAMTVTYITKAPKATKEHFLSIVRLRGYTSFEDQAKFAADFDKQYAVLKSSY